MTSLLAAVTVVAGLVDPAAAAPMHIAPSPGARVEVLPAVSPGRVDIMVYRNHADLRVQLLDDGTVRPMVRAQDLGGDWVVTVWTDDPLDTVRVVPDATGWRLDEVRAAAVAPAPVRAPTLAQIRRGDTATDRCTTASVSLTPLVGRDRLWGFRAAEFSPHLPVWSEAEPSSASWLVVRDVRKAQTETRSPAAHASLAYRLGALHRDLAHIREAAYYFGQASAVHPADGGASDLQRAGALLEVGAWADARTAAWAAADAGAADEAVLEILGIVALGEDAPEGGARAIGRALASASARPDVQLLAGVLLTRDGCAAEAIAPLRVAETHLATQAQLAPGDGEQLQVARLLLTDALLLTGDAGEAREALSRIHVAGLRPEWAGLYRARSRLLPLLEQTIDMWPAALPGLQAASRTYTPEGAESLWLLGQIYEHLGESRSAVQAYGVLLDRERSLVGGAAGARLVQVWEARTRELMSADRPFEALSLHAAGWRPWMVDRLPEAGTLRAVAAAYAAAGMSRRALDTYREVADAEGRLGEDARPSVIAVAGLYARTGRPLDALDAARWLRDAALDPHQAAQVAAVEGASYEALDRRPEAVAGWTAAELDPELAPTARAHLALLAMTDSGAGGGCAGALVALAEAAADPLDPPPRLGDPDTLAVRTALARCQTAVGHADAPTPPPSAAPPVAATTGPPEDIWTALARNNAADRALDLRLGSLAQKSAESTPPR